VAGEDGWAEWSKHVLTELERLSDQVELLRTEHNDTHTTQEVMGSEARNCRENCDRVVQELSKRIASGTTQDREDRRSKRVLVIMVIVCVVAGLFSVVAAIISAWAKLASSGIPGPGP
jgi:t-SNARE complex subunit (syntaxin)